MEDNTISRFLHIQTTVEMSLRSGTKDREFPLDLDKAFKHLIFNICFDSEIVMDRFYVCWKTVLVRSFLSGG